MWKVTRLGHSTVRWPSGPRRVTQALKLACNSGSSHLGIQAWVQIPLAPLFFRSNVFHPLRQDLLHILVLPFLNPSCTLTRTSLSSLPSLSTALSRSFNSPRCPTRSHRQRHLLRQVLLRRRRGRYSKQKQRVHFGEM